MTTRDRLDRAFRTLNDQGVATCLNLHGSTGVREWDVRDYERAATKLGVLAWVGAHVGDDEAGGGFWVDRNTLCYRHRGMPVDELWFNFNHRVPGLPQMLVDALRNEGLDAEWPGGDSCVVVRLGGAS